MSERTNTTCILASATIDGLSVLKGCEKTGQQVAAQSPVNINVPAFTMQSEFMVNLNYVK